MSAGICVVNRFNHIKLNLLKTCNIYTYICYHINY